METKPGEGQLTIQLTEGEEEEGEKGEEGEAAIQLLLFDT